MRFAYQGFTNSGSRRCFLFHGVEEHAAVQVFAIEVELPMFVKYRVPVQDGPSFCLKLLTSASGGGPLHLEPLHSYLVVSEDFRPLLSEREQRAAADAVKRRARSQYRKPPIARNPHGQTSGSTYQVGNSAGVTS